MSLAGRTILQVIPQLDAGGAERTVIEIAQALTRAGAQALVASEGGRLQGELEAAGGELISLPLSTKSPFGLYANAGKLASLCKARSVDLLHARSRAPAWSALLAARRVRLPFVTTYHGLYSGTSTLKTFYNSVMARGDVVIANSQFTAETVRARHQTPDERLVVIPRGVDLERFDPDRISQFAKAGLQDKWQLSRDGLIVLPGRLTDWKGQLVFIEALKSLPREQLARFDIRLVGDAQGRDGYVEQIENAIDSAGLQDLVKITGHHDDMPTLFALANLVVAPSKRPEAFGRVSVEAQAMGCPVIGSDHGGQRETILDGQTGWRVTPGNSDALAAALSVFLSQSEAERGSMRQAAMAHARAHFSIERLRNATLAVYEQLLAPQPERI